MFRLRRVVATVLLLLVIGAGAPRVFAQGPTETPGTPEICANTPEAPCPTGPTETPGFAGPTETPGLVDNIIYLIVTLIP
ncbi:MAG TPA: hypothetical protein VF528_20055 [Pyrinomonadaceae bacterium]|jgi:hypothetical protein